MSEMDANHYPERLASLIVINAPPMLAACWRVIRTWYATEGSNPID
tara:strand:- start:182 stop:319 length:138 start_codon:yes stop_codon:yes gene_type:complete